ncbi:unnamed protein product [Peniophora sp. CBMAI 1063]|nr:unnamed protein product [Peniophora sp. CBMAI 1063]
MPVCAHTYANVILRIAIYPFASCVINLTMIGSVIPATSTDGIRNANDYRILLLSDFIYGGRAVVYALLAATDPALVRAVRAFVAAYKMRWHRDNRAEACLRTARFARSALPPLRREDLVVRVELSTVIASDYTDGRSRADPVNDTKARNSRICSDVADIESTGTSRKNGQDMASESDGGYARRHNADLNAATDVMPALTRDRTTSAVAFELTSPITPAQSLRRRWELATREQAEGEEFMRIL